MPPEQAGSYRSYLLRCWQEARTDSGQPPLWRFMVQDVSGEQRQRSFASFEQLVAFLRTEFLGEASEPEDDQYSTV